MRLKNKNPESPAKELAAKKKELAAIVYDVNQFLPGPLLSALSPWGHSSLHLTLKISVYSKSISLVFPSPLGNISVRWGTFGRALEHRISHSQQKHSGADRKYEHTLSSRPRMAARKTQIRIGPLQGRSMGCVFHNRWVRNDHFSK